MNLFWVFLAALFIISCEGNPVNFNEDDVNNKEFMLFPDGDGKPHLIRLKEEQNEPVVKYDAAKNVHFQLYTRKNIKKPQELKFNDLPTVKKSLFDPSKQTFVVSHGWRNKLNSPVNVLIRTAYLNFDVNVIIVDWEVGASANYASARKNAEATGKHLGKFLSLLVKQFDLSLKKTHLIGHSLGSHVMGFAGKTIQKLNDGQKVSQIVGLDPALPLYSIKRPNERLDKNDAEYVEIIHTNGGKLGFWDPIGHADFYPNQGYSQPGCGADLVGTCAHSRAYEYYAETVVRSESFRSRLCASMNHLNEKNCPLTVNWYFMGGRHFKPKVNGLFYLTTASKSPFGLH